METTNTQVKTKFGTWQKILIAVNILGIICLIFFGAMYLSFDETIRNPNAMLPMKTYEAGGTGLMLGILPMILANTFAFVFIRKPKLPARLLFFVPAIICISLVMHFIIRDEITAYNTMVENTLYNIVIDIQTDDELYALGTSYGIGTEEIGSMYTTNANNSKLKGKQEFMFTKSDFPRGTEDFTGFYMTISVCNDKKASKSGAEDHLYVADTINLDVELNHCYTYVLKGSQAEGYTIEAVTEE